MFPALNFLRQPDLLGMTVRVLLALVCGGAIGIERTDKRRPAGFRTHILICLGAAMTTAAGLWVVAIVGLCCGTAFYEGAVYATVLVLIAEVFFSKLEFHLLRDTREVPVYAEYIKPSCLEDIVSRCHGLGVKIVDLEITKKSDSGGISCAVLSLLSRQGTGKEEILQKLADIEGVQTAIEA